MRLTRYETHSQSYFPFASIFSYSKMMAKSLSNIKPLVYNSYKVLFSAVKSPAMCILIISNFIWFTVCQKQAESH